MAPHTLKVSYEDEDGNEVELDLPAHNVVCSRCDGDGTHVNPAIDGNGISAEEWYAEWDEDEREAYMAGRYDVQCEECHGQRVVLEVDEDLLTDEQKVAYAAYCEHERFRADEEYYDAMTARAERGYCP